MRIGLVVDASCDLPQDFLQKHRIPVLPIRIRLGDHSLVDRRVPPGHSGLLQRVAAQDRAGGSQ